MVNIGDLPIGDVQYLNLLESKPECEKLAELIELVARAFVENPIGDFKKEVADIYGTVNNIPFPLIREQLVTQKTYHDCKYIDLKVSGISFCFDIINKQHKLGAIHLFSGSSSNGQYQKFSGLMPYGITWDSTICDLVNKFGEPDKKIGGRSVRITVSWEPLIIDGAVALAPSHA